MLKEVSKAALAFLLLNGAHLLRNVEECLFLGECVVTDVVRQSVGQDAEAHFRVNRQRLVELC